MGCHDLWKCLATAGLIESLKGGTRGDYERILKELQGKIVAVDCSVWLFEVKSIAQLRKSFATETAAFLKVIFEKATNTTYHLFTPRAISDVQISSMLRMGCTPVLVFEGEVDKSKYELMERRSIHAFMHQRVTPLARLLDTNAPIPAKDTAIDSASFRNLYRQW